MIFLTRDNLLALIDNDTLNVISENNPLNIDEVELHSIEEMKGYLNVRYDIEKIFNGTEKNPLVIMYLSDIVLYHLHTSAMPDNIPELREKRFTSATDWMEKVADGFLNPILPAKEEEEKIPLRYGSSSEKQETHY